MANALKPPFYIQIVIQTVGWLFILATLPSFSQEKHFSDGPPKREIRAVWITTVLGLDWPKSSRSQEQQQSLLEMIDKIHQANFNTIYFQVRSRGDAMYRSRYEPWSHQLTGKVGQDPGWDPLAFFLQEAHARGIEVHAWFNTFLVKTGKEKPLRTNPPHVIYEHPEWGQVVDGEWWLNPGIPAARDYLVNVAMDLVRSYDVDGIQFDFIRYPVKSFLDDKSYQQFGGGQSRDDWRRDNITKFLKAFRDSVEAVKPLLKIGCAPIGIYKNAGGISGLQSYSDLYQDSRRWLREGIVDYLVPQAYWSIGSRPGNPDLSLVAKDWSQYFYNRHVALGVGAYKPEVYGQLPSIINLTRSLGFSGNAFFRYSNIAGDLSLGGQYKFPANIPPMSWKDSLPPDPPQMLQVEQISDRVFRLWWKTIPTESASDQAKVLNIYRSASHPIDFSTVTSLRAIISATTQEWFDTLSQPTASRYYYAVSALDRLGNESTPTAESSVNIPEIAEVIQHFTSSTKLGEVFTRGGRNQLLISYDVSSEAKVSLAITDERDREVRKIIDQVQKAGSYVAGTNLSQLSRGSYKCVLIAGKFSDRKSFHIE